jgi:uncharacterized protein (TIGR03067 family)
MTSRIVVGLFGVVATWAAFGAAQDDAAKKSLEGLEGVWEIKGAYHNGRQVPPEGMPAGTRFTFIGDEVIPPTAGEDGKEGSDTAKVKVDPSKNPAQPPRPKTPKGRPRKKK